MAADDSGFRIGTTPFARRSRLSQSSRRTRDRAPVLAAQPPRLWPITQNVGQNTAEDVNRLNMRDPLTTPSQDVGRGKVIGQAGSGHGVQSQFIFANNPTADNGNG